MRRFVPVQTKDETLRTIQDRLVQTFESLYTSPFVRARVFVSLTLVVGTNTIQHGLGQPYESFLVANPTVLAVTITEVTSSNKSSLLVLNASAACSIDLVVY